MKIKHLIIYAIIISAFVVIANLPASFVLKQTSNETQNFATDVKGTIWEGSANIQNQTPLGVFTWNVEVLKLLLLEYYCHLNLSGDDISINGTANISPFHYAVKDLSGMVSGKLISQYLSAANIKFDKPINFSDLNLNLSSKKFRTASGEINFPGDIITYPKFNGDTATANLPPLHGVITPGGNDALLTINDATNNNLMIKILFSGDGWANIELTPAFLHLFDGYDKSDVSVNIKHQLF